jgi:hypothetical protein
VLRTPRNDDFLDKNPTKKGPIWPLLRSLAEFERPVGGA